MCFDIWWGFNDENIKYSMIESYNKLHNYFKMDKKRHELDKNENIKKEILETNIPNLSSSVYIA